MASDAVSLIMNDHRVLESLFEQVIRKVDSADFDQVFTEFVEAVKHHVEEEESEVLPALRDAVDKATLERLGEEFMRARMNELRKAGFDDEAEHAAAYDGGRTDLADATRDNLYEMAKDADISGRAPQ